MWYNTKISRLFKIKYPILQGPMGGGFSTVDLLASVSNGGGLGSFGCYTLLPDEILKVAKDIEAATDKPYNLNLWVSDVDDRLKNYSQREFKKAAAIYKPYFDELNIPLPELSFNILSKFEQQAEAILKIRPAVFSFIFGIPPKEMIAECRRQGIKTVGSATTADEALALEEAGVDAIVAAGFEAGGHRPSFLRPSQDSLTGLFSLIQQLKASVKTPIIAAGGIVDGKGIAAALTLGADGVQLGTAFLACRESNATEAHRKTLFSDASRHTVVSKSFTGRMGRMIENRISKSISPETAILPFPLQAKFLLPLKAAATEAGKMDMINFWAGQSASVLRYNEASTLLESLITETSTLVKQS